MKRIALPLAALMIMGLAGCSASADENTDTLSIATSTNVYGSIAESIAGTHAAVSSIIDNEAQDPHSYEASARDQLALTRADVVIFNGGGYDPFVTQMITPGETDGPKILNASELSGLIPHEADDDHEGHDHEVHNHADHDDHDHADHDHADHDHADHDHADHGHIHGFNEHVWYSFDAMRAVAVALADHLSEIDPDHATNYGDNLAAFSAEVDALNSRAEQIAGAAEGRGVAVTEPAPLYLLEAIGLQNLTPEAFSAAAEAGSEISPAALNQAIELLTGHQVSLLAHNEQTAGPETEKLLHAATDQGIPVVSVGEIVPEGLSYTEWMTATLAELESALA